MMFERASGFWTNSKDEIKQDFFHKLTDSKSQRENWYQVTPFIAEFYCAISNIGFIYVAWKYKCIELLFAGIASIISHSIPKQWLLYVDKLGVIIAFSKLTREFNVILQYPWLIIPIVMCGTINIFDAYLARTKDLTSRHIISYCTITHVIWHFSSAFMSHIFLSKLV